MKITINASLLIVLIILNLSCAKNDEPPTVDNEYRFNKSMTVDDRERTYLVNLPTNFYDADNFSLVIALHGGGGDALQFESTSKLTDKANAAKFIVVYPEGVASTGVLAARTWNAGACCGYARDNSIDDVKFISAMIDELSQTYKIDPKKVYVSGHSNGGMLAYRLACEITDKIAAIAVSSTSMVVSACNPSMPMPILHLQSMLDTKVPYEGGLGSGIGTANITFPPLDAVLNTWASTNSCTTNAQVLVDDDKYN